MYTRFLSENLLSATRLPAKIKPEQKIYYLVLTVGIKLEVEYGFVVT